MFIYFINYYVLFIKIYKLLDLLFINYSFFISLLLNERMLLINLLFIRNK